MEEWRQQQSAFTPAERREAGCRSVNTSAKTKPPPLVRRGRHPPLCTPSLPSTTTTTTTRDAALSAVESPGFKLRKTEEGNPVNRACVGVLMRPEGQSCLLASAVRLMNQKQRLLAFCSLFLTRWRRFPTLSPCCRLHSKTEAVF